MRSTDETLPRVLREGTEGRGTPGRGGRPPRRSSGSGQGRGTRRPGAGRRRRRGRRLLVVLVVLGVLATGGWVWWQGSIGTLPLREHCTSTASGTSTELAPSQAGNAAVIAAVAVRRGLPGRAATIGIATAMQESKLENIAYGDRDSLGLFQQRPSQGWGTPAQVRDPVYASNAFYDVLVKVEGYEDLPITSAAQEVQRSAFPTAYAEHEPEARILASVLTGYSPGGLSCVLRDPGTLAVEQPGSTGLTGRARAVARAAERETGAAGVADRADPAGTAVRFAATGREAARTAWVVAHWAVARADALQIVSVETDGRRWRRDRPDLEWEQVRGGAPTAAGQVVVRVARGS
jgi:hypothetical protein